MAIALNEAHICAVSAHGRCALSMHRMCVHTPAVACAPDVRTESTRAANTARSAHSDPNPNPSQVAKGWCDDYYKTCTTDDAGNSCSDKSGAGSSWGYDTTSDSVCSRYPDKTGAYR